MKMSKLGDYPEVFTSTSIMLLLLKISEINYFCNAGRWGKPKM